MKRIHNENWIDDITKELLNGVTDLNKFIIDVFVERIADISKRMKNGEKDYKTASEYALQDLPKIKKAVKKAKIYNDKEIDKIFNEVAQANIEYSADMYEARKLPPVEDYTKDKDLKLLVDEMRKITQEDFRNISNISNIGFIDSGGNYKSVRANYIHIIDTAVESVRLGEQDFYETMRREVRGLIDSGVRKVEFESGRRLRIDSKAYTDITTGIRELNFKMQEDLGNKFGADGYEISAHAICAPDHIDIQGKQYTKEEYKKLNESLDRPIGTLNCKHFALPIIIGVSKPIYTDTELKGFTENSNKKMEYKGKEITRYDATQVQRAMEAEIRKIKYEKRELNKIGDTLGVNRDKFKINKKLLAYNKFSELANLRPQPDRMKI